MLDLNFHRCQDAETLRERIQNGQKASSKAILVETDNALSAYFLIWGATSNWEKNSPDRKAEGI